MRSTVRDLRSRPIRNWCAEPRPVTVGDTASAAFYKASGAGAVATLVDTNVCRFTCTDPAPPVALRAGIDQRMPARPGDRVTMLVRMRTDVARTYILQVRRDGTSTSVIGQNINLTTSWAWYRVSGVLPETVVDSVHMGIYSAGATWTVDSWIEISHAMWVKDTYTGEFSDGNTPGWQWTGTPGQSQSIGWPYTLESIAGKPDAIQLASGSTTYMRPEGEPISLFAAYEIRQVQTSGGFLLLGRVGGNIVLERRGVAPYSEGWTRVSNLQSSNLQRSTPNGATLGTHVIGLSYGSPNLLTSVQDGTIYTITYGSLYNTLSAASAFIEKPASDAMTGRTALYTWRRALSEAEMLGVSKWLANKYN